MSDGLLRLLCAVAAFALPLLFAWLMVHRVVRRHRPLHRRLGKTAPPGRPPASSR